MENKWKTDTGKRRCILALCACVLMILCVFVGVVMMLVTPPSEARPDAGRRAFRYFTVLSNMQVALCAAFCIPYEIDGLRYRNYHLPRWAVYSTYVTVTSVAIVFFMALTLISLVKGSQVAMLKGSNLFLHLICPVFAILLLLFLNDDHHIPVGYSFLSLLPLLTYGTVYMVMVFGLGPENGGWSDHYMVGAFVPPWVSCIGVPLVGLGISLLLRRIHNGRHARRKSAFREYWMNCPEYDRPGAEEAVRALAAANAKNYRGGELTVPLRAIRVLRERYGCDALLDDLCEAYCEEYLIAAGLASAKGRK